MSGMALNTALSAMKPGDMQELETFSNDRDVRRDLHGYAQYIRSREVKRLHRTNDLGKADYKRLAKLLGGELEPFSNERWNRWNPLWIDYIDDLARQIGFVQYDTAGVYAGYSSNEPSFPNNYIEFKAGSYKQFLALSPAQQEGQLLDTLLKGYGGKSNEFYYDGTLGRLGCFNSWGSATGVMPTLNFAKIRRFLFDLLATCEPGVWHSTASLIAYLKIHHRFFLIPEQPTVRRKRSAYQIWAKKKETKKVAEFYEEEVERYSNFYEGENRWAQSSSVPDDAPDGFERVEGRYIERFLEGIPLILGYVDVAYAQDAPPEVYPPRDVLRAFRIDECWRQAAQGDIPAPRVTVQANFEIHIEAAIYPAGVMTQLRPLTEVVAEDKTTILRLQKQKVLEQLAQDDTLDVIAVLRELSDRELPQNVVIELQEWAGRADVFTLYTGFGLVEGKVELDASSVVETIAPDIRIVCAADRLAGQLRAAEWLPLRVVHADDRLKTLPKKAKTVFPHKTQTRQAKTRQAATLRRQQWLTLYFPDDELLETFRKALLDARCPVEADLARRALTMPQRYEAQLNAIIATLQDSYSIKLEDIE